MIFSFQAILSFALSRKIISSNVPDFLQVNSTWCNLKKHTHSVFNHACGSKFRYLEQTKNLAKSLFTFFEISQKLQNNFKNCGRFFNIYQVLVIKSVCLFELKLIKNLTFSCKRAGFFVIEVPIISIT